MATTCVTFKRSKKGARVLSKDNQRKVCFKRKEATAAQVAAKKRRARLALKRHACVAKGAPKAACFAILSK